MSTRRDNFISLVQTVISLVFYDNKYLSFLLVSIFLKCKIVLRAFIKFFETAIFSTKYLFKKLVFQWSHFFGKAIFQEELHFHKRIFQTKKFFTAEPTFYNCIFYLSASKSIEVFFLCLLLLNNIAPFYIAALCNTVNNFLHYRGYSIN